MSKSKTVLVVEDNKDEQEKARKIYEGAGFKVIIADSYEGFQKKVRQFNCFNNVSLGGLKFYSDRDVNFPEDKKTGELVDCIITDLTFPMHSCSGSEVGDFGYAVLARATNMGIPCYICTDSNHHGPYGKKGLIEEIIRITRAPKTYSSKKQWDCFLSFI